MFFVPSKFEMRLAVYEPYSRQSLPTKRYRELLGSAICVFNSNNAFIIENILRNDENGLYDWHSLIDFESGRLKPIVQNTISSKCGDSIEQLFSRLVEMRNRIIHSFQITKDEQQVLATKERQKDGGKQFVITEEYLLDFIKQNEMLSNELHDLRRS